MRRRVVPVTSFGARDRGSESGQDWTGYREVISFCRRGFPPAVRDSRTFALASMSGRPLQPPAEMEF